MKSTFFSVILLSLGLVLEAAVPASDLSTRSLVARALPNAPDSYTPTNVSCPASRPTIRSASTLSANETSWLKARRQETVSAMKDLFGHLNMTFDAVSYISNIPNIGIAVSGGGYRALTNGAGALKAFDSRTQGSTKKDNWEVFFSQRHTFRGCLESNKEGEPWQFQSSIIKGPKAKGLNAWNTAEYYKALLGIVSGKRDAGYNTSFTDYWGRALSYQLINATDGGPEYTWSSISLTEDFRAGKMPLPILVADGRNPGETLVGSNSTVYEFNPWEFGTFDPSIFAFAPLEYLGSHFEKGRIAPGTECVRGFDNAGFVMGTSSSLFNQFILRLNTTDLPSTLKDIFGRLLQTLGERNDDIAIYSPNPFYRYERATRAYQEARHLNVVDGGEDGQNLPLHPLIQPTRAVDVIFAVDSSASTNHSWPNGGPLVATYERSLNSTGMGNGTVFPSVPDKNTFVNLGLNTRPTFFGCNSSNLTSPAPLVVYLPNYPYTTFSNKSTFQMEYNLTERDDVIRNGYNVVTVGNGTRDGYSDWSACAGCAILSRSFDRTGTEIPSVCVQCFRKYCWDGTRNSTRPGLYEPTPIMAKSKNLAVASQASQGFTLLATAAMVGYLLL
ncbi:hypothetical protein N7512_006766 [Penicillium capsulatum]|nr:hypothetical protein N7512_006766 [Penicillium capsulatum]